jgi:hypothetical protein
MTHDLNAVDIIEHLRPYPHIFKFVEENWGTVRLKDYLDNLLMDNRDGNRKGFPTIVSDAILSLSLSNLFYLEKSGLEFEDESNGFAVTSWKLPKNF